MLSNDQLQLLAAIQSLAASGRAQTGRYVQHDVDFLANGATVSCVKCREDGYLVHITNAIVSANGKETAADAPPEFIGEHECTLAQQRDRLARWIVANRKQEAA